jgi:hypothetical protein
VLSNRGFKLSSSLEFANINDIANVLKNSKMKSLNEIWKIHKYQRKYKHKTWKIPNIDVFFIK